MRRGFSMVEVLAAVALLSLFAVTAAPLMRDFARSERRGNATDVPAFAAFIDSLPPPKTEELVGVGDWKVVTWACPTGARDVDVRVELVADDHQWISYSVDDVRLLRYRAVRPKIAEKKGAP